MAELLRRDRETYFSYLPKDVTGMIDELGRPIEKGPLRLLRELGEPFSDLSGNQELVRGKYDSPTHQFEYKYYSLLDQTLLQTKPGRRLIDLRAPGDQSCMYSDGCLIYLNNLVYQIIASPSGLLLTLTNPTIRPQAISFDKEKLTRGANRYVYLVYWARLYRFHLDILVLERVPCPVEFKGIRWVKPSLTQNLLIVEADQPYRLDLETNTFTTIFISDEFISDYIVDPLTCLVYGICRTTETVQLVREGGLVLVDFIISPQPGKCFITLSGHFIFQVFHQGKFTPYLYG